MSPAGTAPLHILIVDDVEKIREILSRYLRPDGHAVETAASLIWESLGRGEAVWLTVVDAKGTLPGTLGPGRGWADARLFLERLALAVPEIGRAHV